MEPDEEVLVLFHRRRLLGFSVEDSFFQKGRQEKMDGSLDSDPSSP